MNSKSLKRIIFIEYNYTLLKEVVFVCYNCGCGMPEDDMGNQDNITEDKIKKAAEASGTTVEEAKKNMLEMLQKQVKEKH